MLLETITADIIFLHILPLLTPTDILSLTACNTHLTGLLANQRFVCCNVRNQNGYFRMALRPSTVRTIRQLTLNGSETEHDDVFRCEDLEGVTAAVVVSPIADRQQAAFGMWARRLKDLTERRSRSGDLQSGLSGMGSGAIQQVQRLRLEISLPTGPPGDFFSWMSNLQRIEFIPQYDATIASQYLNYLSQFQVLLSLVADRSRFPALKIIQAAPAPINERYQKPAHQQLLETLWTSALTHVGWKLLCQKPPSGSSSRTRKSVWDDLTWDFCITVKEFAHLARLCNEQDLYPRLDTFITGRIHVHTGGGTVALGTLSDTAVHAVTIRHGRTTNMTAALQLITGDTRVLTIALARHWGSVGELIPSSTPYRRMESFRISGPLTTHAGQYKNNYSAAFVRAVELPQWPRLASLSLPATALQKRPAPGTPYAAICGTHIGAYDMACFGALGGLRALSITQWTSCGNCYLDPDVAFGSQLEWVQGGVESVAISGRMGYYGAVVPGHIRTLAMHILAVLQENRRDVEVDLAALWVTRIGELFPLVCVVRGGSGC